MSPVAPRRRAAALAALSLTALTAASAAPAHAGSLEQITRATGAQGWSPFHVNQVTPLFVSDTGRFAIYRYFPYEGAPVGGSILVRNIVSNTTTALGDAKVREFFGVDKAEQNALVERYDPAANKTTLVLVPLAGGPSKVLYTWNTSVDLQAAFSGDGKTVAVSSANDDAVPGLYTLTVATRAVKQIDSKRVILTPQSISDDGQVIAGRFAADYKGVYYRGTAKTDTPSPTVVSKNGAVVATTGYVASTGWKLTTRTLATGATKSFSLPEGVYDIQWISADGRYFATPWSRETDPATPTKVLDTATGKWTTLAGPYSEAVNGSVLGINADSGAFSLVSRSGRYATAPITLRTPWQLALLDLTGGDLPGDQEPLAATAYVEVSPPLTTCNGEEVDSSLNVYFSQGRSWIGKPKSATIRITADGTQIFNETITTPSTPTQFGGDQRTVPFPRNAKSISITAKVIDADNRTVTESTTVAPRDYCPL